MNTSQILGVCEVREGMRRIEINIERVAIWALVFTNLFFVSYFFNKWFHFF